MALIPRDELGDVWPAVQPGRSAGDYGSARLEPTGPCVVRSFQTFKISYTVGRFGLDDTGAIRIGMRFVQDGGPLQAIDPEARNYVTATASNGVTLTVFPEPYAYRPWLVALRITVDGGYMCEGDTITVTIGDRSGGSPGYCLQTIVEPSFEFKVSVDSCATGQFNVLDDELSVAIVAGPAVHWKLVAPTLRRPGEKFDAGIKVEDAWGNPAVFDGRTAYLKATGGVIENLPDTVELNAPEKSLRLSQLTVAEAGTVRIHLVDAAGEELAVSNPIVIEDGAAAGYWGDLHGQSGETIGINSIDDYLLFARDLAFLDVTGHQGNDFQLTNAFWEKLNRTTASLNEDGTFVVFPGYEWSGNTPVGGDHNVFFRHEGRQIRRSSHAMLADRSDIDTDANTLAELFDALKDEDCVLYAHVGGRPADVSNAHDPKLKTAVEVHSNWGTFEWILTDSLALDHRVGVVGNSDGHKGRPGAGPPGATEFGAYGGLTCFLAPELTRDAIFEAMRRRHHYGTSGHRLHLDVRAQFSSPAILYTRDPDVYEDDGQPCDEAIMGDIVRSGDAAATVSVAVDAPTPIERIDILNGADEIRTLRTYTADQLGRRLRVYWQGAEYRGRSRNTHWEGEIKVTGVEIEAVTPVNQWNPERQLEQVDQHRVVFDAVTSGNFAGVDLVLGESAGADVSVTTNLISGDVRLGDLGVEDHVLDAGGLERQIRLRRLPDVLDQCSFSAAVPVELTSGQDNPIWVRVTTTDGHQAWSSPIYILA